MLGSYGGDAKKERERESELCLWAVAWGVGQAYCAAAWAALLMEIITM